MCAGWILEGSVIGLLLRRFRALVSGGMDKKARQSLDDDPLLIVVELLPQARLRDRDVGEFQIQLRHDSPGLDPMLPAHRRSEAGERQRGGGAAASPPGTVLRKGDAGG